jgi:hypothetical protein
MDINSFRDSRFTGSLHHVDKIVVRTSQGYIEIADDGKGDVKVTGKEYVTGGKNGSSE